MSATEHCRFADLFLFDWGPRWCGRAAVHPAAAEEEYRAELDALALANGLSDDSGAKLLPEPDHGEEEHSDVYT